MGHEIDIQSLSFSYFEGAAPVLSNVSLRADKGTCMAVLGPAASGKTTLLQILSGIMGAQSTTCAATGTVTIGDTLHAPIPDKVLFPQVGLVMQDASVQISGVKETVEEELSFTLDNLGFAGEEKSRRISAVASILDLHHLRHRRPNQLSGGELQRLVLGSIIVAEPRILLLDEPLAALDSLARHRLSETLRSLKRTTTIIVADSSVDFALAVADMFVVLDRGHIAFAGPRTEFLNSLASFTRLLPVSLWTDLIRASRTTNIEPRLLRILDPYGPSS